MKGCRCPRVCTNAFVLVQSSAVITSVQEKQEWPMTQGTLQLVVHTGALLLNHTGTLDSYLHRCCRCHQNCAVFMSAAACAFLCAFQTLTSAAPSRVCVTEENAATPPAATFATVPEVTSPARTAPDVWVSRWPGGAAGAEVYARPELGRFLSSTLSGRKWRINLEIRG